MGEDHGLTTFLLDSRGGPDRKRRLSVS